MHSFTTQFGLEQNYPNQYLFLNINLELNCA